MMATVTASMKRMSLMPLAMPPHCGRHEHVIAYTMNSDTESDVASQPESQLQWDCVGQAGGSTSDDAAKAIACILRGFSSVRYV